LITFDKQILKKMKRLLFIILLVNIKLINGQIISTVAGSGTTGFSGDGGQATAAELFNPEGIDIDAAGNIYIADGSNNRIRKVSTSGIITTIAGNGAAGFSGDAGQASVAALNFPSGVILDATGNLYIADQANHCIRKINTSGVISTIAGIGGVSGFIGDGAMATLAKLNTPSGVAVDAAGNVYIADANNNRIRKVNSSGIITTIAGDGTASFSGDGGQATLAALNHPTGVTIDGAGNLFIAAWGNHRIRKVNTSGIITTVAGNGTAGFSGDGGQATLAELDNPFGVKLDATGNIYLADFINNRIRMINTTGVITTLAGNGTAGFSGDGGQATAAELQHPGGVAFDASGNMYIADFVNGRIRQVTNVILGINQTADISEKIIIYPNPTIDQFYIETNATDKLNVDLYDVNGRHVFSKSVSGKSKIDVSDLNEGVYSLTIKTVDRVINKKLVIVR